MKLRGKALLILGCAMMLGGCLKTLPYNVAGKDYPTPEAALAAVREQSEPVIAQVPETSERIGGILVAVLPTPEYVRDHALNWNVDLSTVANREEMTRYAVGRNLELFKFYVAGVKAGKIFDEVRTVHAANVSVEPDGPWDYRLFANATKDADATWSLAKKGSAEVKALPGLTTRGLGALQQFNDLVLSTAESLGVSVRGGKKQGSEPEAGAEGGAKRKGSLTIYK
ncbi:MAG: hypothetical protein HQL51_09740 [Magnetococcales bacterium]|nr:hypothetical protein [Magnetococcales bacterium]